MILSYWNLKYVRGIVFIPSPAVWVHRQRIIKKWTPSHLLKKIVWQSNFCTELLIFWSATGDYKESCSEYAIHLTITLFLLRWHPRELNLEHLVLSRVTISPSCLKLSTLIKFIRISCIWSLIFAWSFAKSSRRQRHCINYNAIGGIWK